MGNRKLVYNNFTAKTFMLLVIPAYVFPALMSWLSGWLFKNSVLMKASFISIAIPSLVATIITYVLLWQMKVWQKFPSKKYTRVLFMTLLLLGIAILVIQLFSLNNIVFDILLSTVLGTVITTLKLPLKK
ncbi:conserved membrane protein of unknown function [Tenacibaculum sp. 190130A14a]|uniref:Uncharacterized protein n=1 Tax=Tenacibaculum polynesiense TaxID=3137857 RepID=A0ABM9P8Q6_9FLAO